MKSSTVARVMSGSVASWSRILVTIGAQIIVTPIFLSHWTANSYGNWLAFLALTGFLQIVDTGHQTYVGNKFLMFGETRKADIESTLSSALLVGCSLAAIQILGTYIVVHTGLVNTVFPELNGDEEALHTLLLVHICVWGLTGSTGGILIRALSPFGYFSRFAWWGTVMQTMTIILPVFAVMLGGGILTTGLVMSGSVLLINCLMFFDIRKIFYAENITLKAPNIRNGYRNFFNSLILTFNGVFEMIRQQGTRLILSPLGGAAEMAAFATMRTGSNLALQGLNTITNPLLPELMRFLHQKDQNRSEAAFSTIWIVVVAVMAPVVVILQAFIEPIYIIWTRGKIPFDPILFALLSLSVLIYAIGQPALAVITGNNLLKPQLMTSALSGACLVGFMFFLVPLIGIRGAGVSLVMGELVATILFKNVAKRWLRNNNLYWPSYSFLISVRAVIIAAGSITLLLLFPSQKLLLIFVSFLFFALNSWMYYQALPALAINHAKQVFAKMPFLKRESVIR